MAAWEGASADAPAGLARGAFWMWYAFLLAGQVLDLVLTRVGLETGAIAEGNPLMAPIVHTPIPGLLKAVAMAYLALVIVRVLAARRSEAFLLWSLRALGAVTAVVLLLHAWALVLDPLLAAG